MVTGPMNDPAVRALRAKRPPDAPRQSIVIRTFAILSLILQFNNHLFAHGARLLTVTEKEIVTYNSIAVCLFTG